jgi:5'-phosphate synthase pdxT subunit
MRIGVLASQGAFAEHILSLHKLDIEAVPVRLPRELKGLDGLILPGGESTTISKLLDAYDLMKKIASLGQDGIPIFGTCAGMILMAKQISGNSTALLGLMDIKVKRNAFGRQVDSFETELKIPALGKVPFPAVFIRAPMVEHYEKGVEVLASLKDNIVVAVKQGKLLATAFHPELTNDLRFHQYFLDIAAGKRN